ncbi:hypothetical protein CTheo_3332 [Ceratobasidium theobromae]|uniref:BTB domain-containing protein n=1 Tax=Ceratobasidium theobromae TaxID=1582974 RepID=A0A5N5QNA1_9AGAM|nr:hypothetical protein CTheo_3332 [Ceratobasidium theobromae]
MFRRHVRKASLKAIQSAHVTWRPPTPTTHMSETIVTKPLPASNSGPELFTPPPGGDIKLQSKDGVEFQAHIMLLSMASSVFRDMFLVGTKHEAPIYLTEDAEAISTMLEFIYPNRQAPLVTNFDTLESCLRVSQKYDLQSMAQTLDTQISINNTPQSLVHTDPLRAYQLAITFDLPKTKVLAAPLITTSKADLCDPSRLARLTQSHPSSSLIRLIGIQGTRAKILAEVLFNFYKRPMLPTQEHFFYDLSCETCRDWLDKCERNEARAGLYTHHPPSWLLSWANLVYQSLLASPLEQSDDLFHVTILERLEGSTTACQDCLADFWKYRDQRPKFDKWANDIKTILKDRLACLEPLYAL